MKIDNHKNLFSAIFRGANETNVKPSPELYTSKVKKVEKDLILVSETSMDILRFMNELNHTENIRYEKVDEIQRKIEENTYRITGKDVVAKLLEGN